MKIMSINESSKVKTENNFTKINPKLINKVEETGVTANWYIGRCSTLRGRFWNY